MIELSPFGVVLLFTIGAVGLASVSLFAASLLRPDRPNDQKRTTYESGEDTVGTAWGRFNPRYYIVALIFVLFEVEIIFLFPWATVFGQQELIEGTDGLWGWLALTEMFIFVGFLAFGLAWAWAKGFLDWVVPKPVPTAYESKVPMKHYEEFNKKVRR